MERKERCHLEMNAARCGNSRLEAEFLPCPDDDSATLPAKLIGDAQGGFAARGNSESEILAERVFAGRKGRRIAGRGQYYRLADRWGQPRTPYHRCPHKGT